MMLTLVSLLSAAIIALALMMLIYARATERRFRNIEKLLARSMPVYGQKIPRDTEQPRRGF